VPQQVKKVEQIQIKPIEDGMRQVNVSFSIKPLGAGG